MIQRYLVICIVMFSCSFNCFHEETITKSLAAPENYHVYGGVVCDLTVMSCTVSFALLMPFPSHNTLANHRISKNLYQYE